MHLRLHDDDGDAERAQQTVREVTFQFSSKDTGE